MIDKITYKKRLIGHFLDKNDKIIGLNLEYLQFVAIPEAILLRTIMLLLGFIRIFINYNFNLKNIIYFFYTKVWIVFI